uniref:Reverse transcriptase n=1 Tax=Timema genevievae TaxID=629358 RepID=A0A7R9JZ01_TIMGE|nr:unnamed protein product [Timema genevievae]
MRFSLAKFICHRRDRAGMWEGVGWRSWSEGALTITSSRFLLSKTWKQRLSNWWPLPAQSQSRSCEPGTCSVHHRPLKKTYLKRINWDRFTNVLRKRLGPTPTFRRVAEIDRGAEFMTSAIKGSLEASTPRHDLKRAPQASLPDSILRHAWQISRDPVDKANWSRKVHAVHEIVQEYRNSVWEDKIESLCVEDRSLWRMMRNLMPGAFQSICERHSQIPRHQVGTVYGRHGSSSGVVLVERRLQTHLTQLKGINVEKSAAELFTWKSKFYRPAPLQMFEEQIRWANNVKYLGLILDTKLTWRSTLSTRNGQTLYKQLLSSTLSYACPAWGH